MDLYRFYVPDLRQQAATAISLPDDQAHHARTVLRLETGQPVVLFDGQGAWHHAKVERMAKSGVTLTLVGAVTIDPPPVPDLTIATAVPKGDRAEWLIEQASQLNVTTVQWLDCARSVVKPREGGAKMGKWRRLAIESAKQCSRTHLLRIAEPLPLDAVLRRQAAANDAAVLWLEPRGGTTAGELLAGLPPDRRILALVGPEGGWSPEEFARLESAAGAGHVRRLRLTSTVLRIETACAAVAAIVMSRKP